MGTRHWNLGFEYDVGEAFGGATLWTVESMTALYQLASWETNPGTDAPLPAESFDANWSEPFLTTTGSPTAALFGTGVLVTTRAWDGFEAGADGWDTAWLAALAAATEAEFDTTTDPEEDFEHEWTSGSQTHELQLTAPTAALFHAGTVDEDTFEAAAGWDEVYQTSIGSSTLASFDAGGTPENVEDWEEVRIRQGFVVSDLATDLFYSELYPALDDERVMVDTTGVLPAGLSANWYYWLNDVTSDTFTLSVSLGGPLVDITSYGTGEHTLIPDEAAYWTEKLYPDETWA